MRIFPRPRPREAKTRRNDIEVIQDKVTRQLREICHGDAWQKRREEVWERDGRRCVDCRVEVPLHNETQHGIQRLVRRAAEVHHLNKRGMGGGKRNDCMDNLVTLCWRCHNRKT